MMMFILRASTIHRGAAQLLRRAALLMVDLRMAKGRFLRVFDVVDEKCTSSGSELENGQRAGSRIGAVRNLFGRSSINGFDFREAIGNPERGTPKQLGSATMNRGGS